MLDKRTFLCYTNQAVFETAGAVRHNGETHLPRNVRLIAMLSSPFPGDGKGAFFCNITKKPLTETNL